ncbi:MAG: hypothetical protein ABR536_03075 [Solirubrobacterales bacterium]
MAVAAVIPASASAAITSQTLKAVATPSKVSQKGRFPLFPAPVSLRVDTDTTYDTPLTLGSRPSPAATNVNIDFDNDFKFTTKGIATCNPILLTGTTTAQAIAVCGASQVGAGSATLGGIAGPASAVVTAFNGTPVNGQPQILLHSRIGAPLNTTAILSGVLTSSPVGGDYGRRLVVTVPPVAGGNEVITHFDTTVNRRFKVKKTVRINGVRKTIKVKSGYVTAICRDKNKTWNFRGVFNYQTFNGPPASSSLTASTTQKCQPVKPKS